MTTVIDTQPLRSLDTLAAAIREGHEAVGKALVSAVEHAIATGEALMEARAQVPRGQWRQWQHDHAPVGSNAASWYMRMAEYADMLRAEEVTSIGRARRLLRAADARIVDQIPAPRAAIVEAAELVRTQGLSVPEAARLTGAGAMSVYRELDPDLRNRQIDQRRRSQQKAQARRQAELEANTKAAARKAGGAISEAYAVAERLQDVLAKASDQTSSRVARDEFRKAGEHYRRMRDHIVRGLGAHVGEPKALDHRGNRKTTYRT